MFFINRLKDSRDTILLLVGYTIIIIIGTVLYTGIKRNSREDKRNIELLSNTIKNMNDSIIKDGIHNGKQTNVSYINKITKITTPEKIKNTKEYIKVSTNTHDSIKVPVFIKSNGIRKINYTDGYLTLRVLSYKDSANIGYTNKDTLDLYVYNHYRHKFLFFKWGKQEQFRAFARNRKTTITSLKIIKALK